MLIIALIVNDSRPDPIRSAREVWSEHWPDPILTSPKRERELCSKSGGRTLVVTDSLSKFKADSISKNGLFIYDFLDIESALCRLFYSPLVHFGAKSPNPDSITEVQQTLVSGLTARYSIYRVQSGPDIPEPRFTGRISFPRSGKLMVFDPDIPDTPIYRAKPFPPSIPVNRGPTV
eukprot:sb/3471913/